MTSCREATWTVLPGSSSTLALPPASTPSFYWTVKLMMLPLYQGERKARASLGRASLAGDRPNSKACCRISQNAVDRLDRVSLKAIIHMNVGRSLFPLSASN